jgi:hypothetical protein
MSPTLCTSTTYHIWNSTSDLEVEELYDGWSGCIQQPFNIEVRLCNQPQNTPVELKLWCKNGYVKRGKQYIPPYFLFGDIQPDVWDSTNDKLFNDDYSFYTTIEGDTTKIINFTQSCP